MTAQEVALAKMEERVDNLEKRMEKHEELLEAIRAEVQKLREDFGRRPTWPVTIAVTILSTLTGSMAMYIITNL